MDPHLFTNYDNLKLYCTGPIKLTNTPILTLHSSWTNDTYNYTFEPNHPIEEVFGNTKVTTNFLVNIVHSNDSKPLKNRNVLRTLMQPNHKMDQLHPHVPHLLISHPLILLWHYNE